MFTLIARALLIVAAVVGFTHYATAAAPLTPREAATLLSKSVVQFTERGSAHCTASKIAPGTFLTAAHCARSSDSSWRVESDGLNYQYIRSVTVPVLKKKDDRAYDWAILHASTENADIPALTLGCAEEPYLGMPVAYYGYSSPLAVGFSVGYVASLEKTKESRSNIDFVVDLQAAPGASGAPIISLDTGHVIGVLIEGVREARAGFYLIGVQSLKSVDLCPDLTPADELGSVENLNSPF